MTRPASSEDNESDPSISYEISETNTSSHNIPALPATEASPIASIADETMAQSSDTETTVSRASESSYAAWNSPAPTPQSRAKNTTPYGAPASPRTRRSSLPRPGPTVEEEREIHARAIEAMKDQLRMKDEELHQQKEEIPKRVELSVRQAEHLKDKVVEREQLAHQCQAEKEAAKAQAAAAIAHAATATAQVAAAQTAIQEANVETQRRVQLSQMQAAHLSGKVNEKETQMETMTMERDWSLGMAKEELRSMEAAATEQKEKADHFEMVARQYAQYVNAQNAEVGMQIGESSKEMFLLHSQLVEANKQLSEREQGNVTLMTELAQSRMTTQRCREEIAAANADGENREAEMKATVMNDAEKRHQVAIAKLTADHGIALADAQHYALKCKAECDFQNREARKAKEELATFSIVGGTPNAECEGKCKSLAKLLQKAKEEEAEAKNKLANAEDNVRRLTAQLVQAETEKGRKQIEIDELKKRIDEFDSTGERKFATQSDQHKTFIDEMRETIAETLNLNVERVKEANAKQAKHFRIAGEDSEGERKAKDDQSRWYDDDAQWDDWGYWGDEQEEWSEKEEEYGIKSSGKDTGKNSDGAAGRNTKREKHKGDSNTEGTSGTEDNKKYKKKESDKVIAPKFPTVTTTVEWGTEVGRNLASAYTDKKEIDWFGECRDESVSFERLGRSGKRFASLDQKLSHSLFLTLPDALKKKVNMQDRQFMSKGQCLTGRQIARMVYQHFKFDDHMSAVYGVSDLSKILWPGDDKMQNWLDIWTIIEENIDEEISENTRRRLMAEQILEGFNHGSKELKEDYSHFEREKSRQGADYSSQFLVDAVQRAIDRRQDAKNKKDRAAELIAQKALGRPGGTKDAYDPVLAVKGKGKYGKYGKGKGKDTKGDPKGKGKKSGKGKDKTTGKWNAAPAETSGKAGHRPDELERQACVHYNMNNGKCPYGAGCSFRTLLSQNQGKRGTDAAQAEIGTGVACTNTCSRTWKRQEDRKAKARGWRRKHRDCHT